MRKRPKVNRLKLVDASVIVRFLTRDDSRKAARARRLILESGQELVVSEIAFWEVVYVLEKYYALPREETFRLLTKLLSSGKIEFMNRELLLQALVLYREHAVSFADAYQVALGRAVGAEAIYTYDEHFGAVLKFPSLEP